MNIDAKQVLTEWLVLAAQRGDERAFRELFDLWRADTMRLSLARVGDPAGADEVVGESWVGIARGLPGLDDPACFPRWAFRIVERKSADWIRRRVAQRKREALAAEEADRILPAAPAHAAAAAVSDEAARLRASIRRLSADRRELLHLFYDLGRSVAEIAEVFAVPAGTIKSRLFAVRETLKRQLEMKSND